jgi:hypothetical protein
LREGQTLDTEESIEEKSRVNTKGEGSEEDGTPSSSRLSQDSHRVTFTLWSEGTGTEADEGLTKAMMTKSERSLQYMEEASMAKQAWTQHLKEMEVAGGMDREPEQDLRQLRDKDQVQTLLSLLTWTSKGRDFTRGEVEDLLREGRVWIKSLMQPCLHEVRGWRGEAS